MRDAFLAVDAATDLRAHARDLRRIRRSRGASSALIDGGGRVRPAMPTSWLSGVVDTSATPDRVRLPSGRAAEVEPRYHGPLLADDDVEAMYHFARAADHADPRRDVAAARLRLPDAADLPTRA